MSGVRGIEAHEGGSGVLRHMRARASQIDRVGLLIGDRVAVFPPIFFSLFIFPFWLMP